MKGLGSSSGVEKLSNCCMYCWVSAFVGKKIVDGDNGVGLVLILLFS